MPGRSVDNIRHGHDAYAAAKRYETFGRGMPGGRDVLNAGTTTFTYGRTDYDLFRVSMGPRVKAYRQSIRKG